MSVTIDGKIFKYIPDGDCYKLVPVAEDNETLPEKEADKAPEEEGTDASEEDDDDDDDEDEPAMPKKHKKGNKPQRCSWTSEEEEKLLDLCYDRHVMDKIDGKCGNLPHAKIFKSISVPLNESKLGRGPKTAAQCKSKYKKLKKSFYDCLRKKRKSGEGRTECKHYERLCQLFARRPRTVSQEWGVDSQPAPMEMNAEDDAVSLDSASALSYPPTPSGSTTPSTSSDAAKTHKLTKYKSVGSRRNPIVDVLNKYMERSEEELRKQNDWCAQQLEAQANMQREMLLSISNSFQSGMTTLASLFGNQGSTATSPQPRNSVISLPNINFADINFAAMATPAQSPNTQSQAEAHFVSSASSLQTPNKQNSTPPTVTVPSAPVRRHLPMTVPVRPGSFVLPSMQSPGIPAGSKMVRLPDGKIVIVASKNNGQGEPLHK